MWSDDSDLEEELRPKALRAPGSTHCNVPLKASLARAALGKPAPGQYVSRNHPCKSEYNRMINIVGPHHVKFLDMSRHQYRLLNSLLVQDHAQIRAEWNQQFQVAEDLWAANISALNQLGPLQLPSHPPQLSQKELVYLYPSYLLRCFYEEAVLSSGSAFHQPQYWWSKNSDGMCVFYSGEIRLCVGPNLFLIQSPEGTALLSRDHLTVLADLASQRYLLRLYSLVESRSSNPSFISTELLDALLLNGDEILYYGGNRAYKIIYSLEPLALSELVGDIPVGNAQAPTFKDTMDREIRVLAHRHGVFHLYVQRSQYLSNLKENPNHLSQVFGLYRIWGHPTVEPLEGASALKKIATQVRMLHMAKAQEISNKFKEEFIVRYIHRFKHWPELNCDKLSTGNLIRKGFECNGNYPLRQKEYRRSHLALVKFNQCFPVDPKFDLIEMLSDKALSLSTPELIKSLGEGRGAGSSIQRSVLLAWLSTDLHDPVKFLDMIDQVGFPEWESSIGLKEKEREGKIDARLFGLTTLIKRMYIVLTEAMLAEHLIPLFPEITMVDDEISLDKKRYHFTALKGKRRLFTSLDFSKWNSNMREEETFSVFQDFDHLFGFTKVFVRTHEMFKSSFMYLLNGSFLPTVSGGKLVPSLGSWTGHLGGIEGLRQKGWTLWTVSLILLAAENHPISISLMGQGDNQIIRETFSDDLDEKQMLEAHFKFLQSLNDLLQDVGPPLKLEETWTSADLFAYGKYLIYKGAPLPMSAKRLCRMFRMSNEDFPTLESSLSSLTANYSSALACSHTPGYLYYLYVSELVGLFQLFLRSSYLQDKRPLTAFSRKFHVRVPIGNRSTILSINPCLTTSSVQPNSIFVKLCLLPRCLGGFPVINMLQSLLRGFPDEVNLAVSSLRLIYGHVSPEIKNFIRKILSPPLSSEISYQMLFEHPTALNLLIPPAPSEARRNLVVDFLKSSPRITNSYFKTFINLLDSKIEEPLFDYLSGVTPFNPRVLGVIAAATVEARARHIAGKLQKTKTISGLAVSEGNKDIYRKVMSAELNHFGSVLRLITGQFLSSVEWTESKCTMDHVSQLRNNGWKKDIVGVDCVSPYEFMILENVSPSSFCSGSYELDKGYMAVRLKTNLTFLEMEDPLIMGPHVPYRGSVTRQKVTGYGDKLAAQADPLLTKVLRLFSLIGWATPPKGNLSDLISRMLTCRTDLDPSLLIPDSEFISGSIHHRLQDERSGHGGSVVVLPNYGSKIGFDTFPLTAYSKGSKNVNLMFQSFMSLSTVLVGWKISLNSRDLPYTMHMHVKTSCCVRTIQEDLMDHPEIALVPLICYKDNPYLFIPAEKAFPKAIQVKNFPVTLPLVRTPEEAQLRLIASVAFEIFTMLSPNLWNSPASISSSRGIVINWALRLPLLRTFECLAFLFVVHYIPSMREESLNTYLIRVHERLIKSPLSVWSQLSNLIHTPNASHEIASAIYHTDISGNPCLTPEIWGRNLRALTANIILTWSSTPTSLSRVEDIPILASPFCGLSYHPAIQIIMKEGLRNGTITSVPILRMNCISILTSSHVLFTQLPLYQKAKERVAVGSKLIYRDSLDSLCKLAPNLTSQDVDPDFPPLDLPSAVMHVQTYHSSQLIYSESEIVTLSLAQFPNHSSHSSRPLASPTSGPYKGLSILNEISENNPHYVLCLGDGAGGFSWSALRFFPTAKVMYNTLAHSVNSIQQTPPIPYLPALAGWKQLESRLLPLHLVNEEISDITDPLFVEMLKKKVEHNFQGVMCDAECPEYLRGINPLKLAKAVLSVCTVKSAEWVLFKTYALSPRVLRQQCSIFLSLFEKIVIFRSLFSNNTSSEVYIYGTSPTVSRPWSLSSDRFTGYQLPLEMEVFVRQTFLESLKGYPSVTQSCILQYSAAISPDYIGKLFRQLNQGLPFLLQDNPMIYPHSVLKWIGQSTMKKPGFPSLFTKNMETTKFEMTFLQRWAAAFLIVWTSLDHENVTILSDQISSLYFIWYRLINGSWEFSLYCGVHPPPKNRDVKGWPISSLLNSMHLKIVHRMRGIIHMINPRIVSLSPGIVRGNLDANGVPLKARSLAVDPWAKAVLQSAVKDEVRDLASGWKSESQLDLFRRSKLAYRRLK